MTDANHARLLQLQNHDLQDRTPFCPEDQQIAEYFDGGLQAAEKAGLERHLAECRHCRARVGVIQRMQSAPADLRIPGGVLAAARQMAGSSSGRRFRAVSAWGAAAMLVVSLAVLLSNRPGTSQAIPDLTEGGKQYRLVRSVSPTADGVRVLHPAPDSRVRPGARFDWSTVPGSLHYDVFVLSGVGDVVVTERVGEPEWSLGQALDGQADGPYYLRVVAYLPDGRKLQSRHVRFEFQGE